MDETIIIKLEDSSNKPFDCNGVSKMWENRAESDAITTDQRLISDVIKQEPIETVDCPLLAEAVFDGVVDSAVDPLGSGAPRGQHSSRHGHILKVTRLTQQDINEMSLPDCQLPKNTTVVIPRPNEMSVPNEKKIFQKRRTKANKQTDPDFDPISRRWQCPSCDKSYTKQCTLLLHIRVHTNFRPYQCSKCKLTFTHIANLTVHIRTHTNERPYACQLCPSRFTQRCALARHKLFHSGERPYPCEVCPKRFFDLAAQQKHIRNTHRGEKNFPCPFCDKRLTEKGALKRHIRTHTKEKPFDCDVCKKCFSEAGVLKRHMSVHTGYKPWKCDHCGWKFADKGSMTKHIQTHFGGSGIKYACEFCVKTFSSAGNRRIHVQSVHEKLKPFGCDRCSFTSSSRTYLADHLKRHEQNRPHGCKLCGLTFGKVGYMLSHMRVAHGNETKFEDDYQCTLCDKRYCSKKSVRRHIETKHAC